jgi:predicted ribosomally synthesized peptide with nif11-like leader
MSIENAQSFYVRVTTDEKFRTQLEQIVTAEERQQIIQAAGYKFTSEEWETAKKQILAASDLNESELSDAELTSISGGIFNFPGMVAAYGVVIGEIDNLLG